MKKRYIPVITALLLFLLPYQGLAQKEGQQLIDSIMGQLIKQKQDTNRVNTYDDLANAYMHFPQNVFTKPHSKGSLDSLGKALPFIDKEYQLSARLKWNNGIVLSYYTRGNYYRIGRNFDEAYIWYRKIFDLPLKKALQQIYINWLSSFASNVNDSFELKGKTDEQLAIFFRAVNLFKTVTDKTVLSSLYERIGRAYSIARNNTASLNYYQQAVNCFNVTEVSEKHVTALIDLALAYQNQHNLPTALAIYQQAQTLQQKLQYTNDDVVIVIIAKADVYLCISRLYRQLHQYKKALNSDLKAISFFNSHTKSINGYKGTFNLLAAKDYRSLGDYDNALKQDKEALAVPTRYKANYYYDFAATYYGQKKYMGAWSAYQDAEKAPKPATYKIRINDKMLLASIYMDAPDSVLIKAGIKPADRYKTVLDMFNADLNDKGLIDDELVNLYRDISQLYEKLGDNTNAFKAYKRFITTRDSIDLLNNQTGVTQQEEQFSNAKREDSIRFKNLLVSNQLKTKLLLSGKDKELQQSRFLQSQASLQAEQTKVKSNEQALKASKDESALADKTVELQKTEISDKRKQSYYLFAGIAALLGLSFFIAQNYRNQRKANKLLAVANNEVTAANKTITAEKQRSDDLLLNILPADVAEELKEKGSANARQFDEVTVLFTDFVNFTTVSEHLTPQQLVNELDTCFKAFDGIMETHHIEKIKTIGDAYLAVAGLPNADVNHAANTIRAAFEIQDFIRQRKLVLGDKSFDIRIGIHSGSVVAGIVGVKKFAYDIWGDTVNTAARMEQNSEPGRINVSEKTYQLVKDKFTFTYRGEIEAKNKGALKMYFVE